MAFLAPSIGVLILALAGCALLKETPFRSGMLICLRVTLLFAFLLIYGPAGNWFEQGHYYEAHFGQASITYQAEHGTVQSLVEQRPGPLRTTLHTIASMATWLLLLGTMMILASLAASRIVQLILASRSLDTGSTPSGDASSPMHHN
jgi:hypothetical protein